MQLLAVMISVVSLIISLAPFAVLAQNTTSVPSNAIHIQTAAQLAGIGGTQSAGKYYVLDNDINLVSAWVPINDFRGTFDGNGKVIKNLNVLASSSSNRQYAGLFGQITTGSVAIKNLGVEIGSSGINAYWSVTSNAYAYAGGLVASFSGSSLTIDNCYVKGGSVSATANRAYSFILIGSFNSYAYAGKILGLVSSGTVTIRNSSVNGGDVNTVANVASGAAVVSAYSYAGGIVGYKSGGTLTLQNCYSTQNKISATFSSNILTGGHAYAGHLIGSGSASIDRCYYLSNQNLVTSFDLISSIKDTRGTPYTNEGKIELTSVKTVKITASNQVKAYSFTAPTTGIYTFCSSNSANGAPYGWLCDSNMRYLTRNDLKFSYILMAGQEVYIGVGYSGSETGSYALTVTNSAIYGSGTENDPYRITTAPELVAIGGSASAGKYYRLENDITLADEWWPINDFQGIFDGDNHVIKNLYISSSSNRQYAGLFGQITAGSVAIKNLGVEIGSSGINAYRSLADDAYAYAGGLVASFSGSSLTIDNCYVKGGSVSATANREYTFMLLGMFVSETYAGKLVGFASGTVKINRSSAIDGNINSVAKVAPMSILPVHAYSYAGGIIARSKGDTTLQNCYSAQGEISAKVSDSIILGVECYTGHLIGSGGARVTSCFYLNSQSLTSNAVFPTKNTNGTPYTFDRAIALNSEISSTSNNPLKVYSFTAPSYGQYTFYSPNNLGYGWLCDSNMRYITGNTLDLTYALTATLMSGQRVYIGIEGTSFYTLMVTDSPPQICTVSYNANGGINPPTDSNSIYVSGATVTVLGRGIMTRAGHTFQGWTANSTTGKTYAMGNTFTITGDTTFYALWTDASEVITPYSISNTDQLRAALTGGEATANRYVILTNDINVGSWTPIDSFQGTLDGAGHTITLTTNVNRSFGCAGLFGVIDTGTVTIKNLSVKTPYNGYIYADAPYCSNSRAYAGGLIGRVTGGTVIIENCYFEGNVKAESLYYDRPVPLYGADSVLEYVFPSLGKGSIKTLVAMAATLTDAFSDKGAWSYAGGLIGHIDGNAKVTISNSYAHGTVLSDASFWTDLSTLVGAVSDHARSGGLVGQKGDNAQLYIGNCYAANSVDARVLNGIIDFRSARGYAGGLIGIGSFTSNGTNYRLGELNLKGNSKNNNGVDRILSYSDMRNKLSFNGWDFTYVWGIDSSSASYRINSGYPYLRVLEDSYPHQTLLLTASFSGGSISETGFSDNLVYSIDKNIELFADAYVDDILLTFDEDYSISESTTFTLFQRFLDTLPEGIHTLTANFSDGTIVEKQIIIRRNYLQDDVFCFVALTDGEELLDVITVLSGKVVELPKDPVKDGFIFDGWYHDAQLFDANMPITENVVLIAQWKGTAIQPTVYAVIYNINGGAGALPSSNYVQGATVTVSITVPSRSGYTFNGWFYNGNVYTGGQTFTMPANNVELIVQWTENPTTYEVSYNGNGGSSVPTDSTRYVQGVTVTVASPAPTRSGYTFNGWSYGGNTYQVGQTFAMPKADVTLTAQWTENTVPTTDLETTPKSTATPKPTATPTPDPSESTAPPHEAPTPSESAPSVIDEFPLLGIATIVIVVSAGIAITVLYFTKKPKNQ